MSFTHEIIEKAVEDGHTFIVLEPKESFKNSVKEFHIEEKRLVYNVDALLQCLKDAYGWDAVEALEWFDYNVFDLTFMTGGPIFYDEFEEKYLTLESQHVTL
tara:strand:+ start:614 stop:919 length:306 start_codon:yes stop_codon:yes gene_type:complete